VKQSANIEDVLMAWGELKYREHSLGRDAEEREWQEAGLFYQRRQWLEWKDSERRYVQLKPDKRKPRPMPVSNYFARTVNQNANQLGAKLIRVTATPKSDDPRTRRAAEYAEMAKDALDQESNLRLLNPLLAKHTALWGMGVLKDEIDTTTDQEELDEQEVETSTVTGCLDCGSAYEGDDEPNQQMMSKCPDCGSMNTTSWERQTPVTASTYVSGKGLIRSRVCPVFEIYLPRDVQNANLAGHLVHRYRKSLSAARRRFGERADDLKGDDYSTNQGETRMDSLRTLASFNFLERANNETCTITEVWTKWDELPQKLQEALEEELGEQEPEEGDDAEMMGNPMEGQAQPQDEMLAQIKQYGLFFIYSSGCMLQWGPNPFVDPDTDEAEFPYTFFLWDIDPASVYPKGIAADLIPLQKRLNRLDSLIELAMMTNAAGKWLWPKTQNNVAPPSGDPSDVALYDPLGDGKVKPEFVQPNPFSASVWQYRASILSDFEQLGLSLGVMNGESPGSDVAFRTVAYLGAKASEQLNTQRYLWESAHCLHYKKLLSTAKWVWDEERQVKIAGPNGRMLFESFTGEDLRGVYEIDFVEDSSIPKTPQERLQMIQQLIMGQLIDLSDPQNRQYLYDIINLEGLNLTGEKQFRKAERDLEMIKRGELPHESPYQDWQIELKIFANFTLDEEFEALDPQLQGFVLGYCEYLNEKVTQIQDAAMMQNMMANSNPQVGPPGAAPAGGDPNNKTLAKVPGKDSTPAQAENAAQAQGNSFAKNAGA
jgi:predicted  nucleic acid-binding Zn-ribbon protein